MTNSRNANRKLYLTLFIFPFLFSSAIPDVVPVTASATTLASSAAPNVASFATWQTKYFTPAQLADPSMSGFSADPYGSGISNLLAYALQLDPAAAQLSDVPTATPANGHLTMTYLIPFTINDVSYVPEVSTDLKTWSSGVSVVQLTSSASVGGITITAREILPSSATSHFMRLRVVQTAGAQTNLVTTPAAGASVAFTTYEGEAASLGKGASETSMNSSNLASIGQQDLPVTEASGRAYATLNSVGGSLTFNVTQPANAIVVRHNVPYQLPFNNKTGPGATLHLWVNNETTPRKVTQILYTTTGATSQVLNALSLSSYHNKATTAFWEETRALISGASLNVGDKLRLEVDAGDVGTPYNIDSIDLEKVPVVLVQPANTLSVMSYGAYGDGIHDDSLAIQNTINHAETTGQNVWIPSGIYNQSAQFSINKVKVYGAGMWYTNLVCIFDPQSTNFSGCMGFSLSGDGDEVHDMSIDSAVHVSRTNGGKAFIFGKPGPTNWVIQNIWVTHSIIAMWISNDSNGLATGCRVRFTYADGIHIDGNSNHDKITNCHIRGAGDDGIAILSTYSSRYAGASHDNIVSNNTVVANWSAANCDLAGGYNNVIESNYFADSDFDGSFVINMPGSFPMYNTTGATISGNIIVRGGGDIGGQQRGAIWIWPNYGYPTTMPAITNVTFASNQIINSLWRGIQLARPYATQGTSMTFSNNVINGVINLNGGGVAVDSTFVGSAAFTRNSISSIKTAYKNSATTTFSGSGSGNIPAFSFP